MKNIIKVGWIALALLLTMTSCATVKFDESDVGITRLIHNKNTFLVDVRTPAEYQAEPIPGAVNIPVDEIQDHIAEFKGKKQIVVYCKSGKRAARAKKILEDNGIKDVYSGTSYQRISKLLKESK